MVHHEHLKLLEVVKRGRPRKTWSECIKADLKSNNLVDIDPLNRVSWRSNVRRSSRLLSTPEFGTPAADDK